MYAFRKPFTAAEFEGEEWYKVWLVSSQVAGYMLSKFIGIKVVSEMSPRYRAVSILGLIGLAELALLLFAITPKPWGVIWLFANGLPLGMVFGLVLGFLEGRVVTEALSAGLCASFIVSSGFVKSVGRWLLEEADVNVYWMPFVTGLIFVIPLTICVGMLSQIPRPSPMDEQVRSRRAPMFRAERRQFLSRHWLGVGGLLTIYMLLTVVRGIRDDFAPEIWKALLGTDAAPEVFTISEFWVMIGVVLVNGFTIAIRNNRIAFLSSMGLLGLGFAIVLTTLVAHTAHLLSPMGFMILLGLGMYIPYVAFHTTVFERMVAAFREVGTIGYLMYLADAAGYLGYVGLLMFHSFATKETQYLPVLTGSSLVLAIVSGAITLLLGFHFYRSVPRTPTLEKTSPADDFQKQS